MELKELFERVNELTGKYPGLYDEEIYELRNLSRKLAAECDNAVYDIKGNQN